MYLNIDFLLFFQFWNNLVNTFSVFKNQEVQKHIPKKKKKPLSLIPILQPARLPPGSNHCCQLLVYPSRDILLEANKIHCLLICFTFCTKQYVSTYLLLQIFNILFTYILSSRLWRLCVLASLYKKICHTNIP